MHDREKLYRFMWENTGASNKIEMKQQELAVAFGISYQRLSIVMKEYTDMGMISKNGHSFVLQYDPDQIPWDKYVDLRHRYIRSQREGEVDA